MDWIGVCVGLGAALVANYLFNQVVRAFTKPTVYVEDLMQDVLAWCKEMYPVRKKMPLLELSDMKTEKAGEYNYYSNTITIYINNNSSQQEIIDTMIHEYVHYYLLTSEAKYNLYQKQLEQYGYENHPQEIWCNTLADKLTKLYIEKEG
jgi:Zn-dependent peptidase ImmA (M78 family)